MKVGLKRLDDAIMDLGSFSKDGSKNFNNKKVIQDAIEKRDYNSMREISVYFYEASGIYRRLCQYLAYLYMYDWFVVPYTQDKAKSDKVLAEFAKILYYLDNSEVKKVFKNIALEVVKSGVYYGYLIEGEDHFSIQQLPSSYCRSRFNAGSEPAVELNLKYFDTCFRDVQYRLKVLSMFPKEIQKAYVQFKSDKLVEEYPGSGKGWCLLDPNFTFKFNLAGSDAPPFIGVVPSIIDLDQAQELDRKKTMQQLLKIIIQKLPLDKNGDLIFDVDEARDIHNNAVGMLKRAVGVDVLTTFADIEVADMQDRNSTTTKDDLLKVERTVYNNSGISQNLFNTDGNIALEKSISNDESLMQDLLLQFQRALNKIVKKFNKNKQFYFRVQMLNTTVNNYKELSKLYKEHASLGYSKILPQLALGHSQSSIIATLSFEQDMLSLVDLMIPPKSSNTMSANDGESAGRPEKEDSEKSDKTIANKEAIG